MTSCARMVLYPPNSLAELRDVVGAAPAAAGQMLAFEGLGLPHDRSRPIRLGLSFAV